MKYIIIILILVQGCKSPEIITEIKPPVYTPVEMPTTIIYQQPVKDERIVTPETFRMLVLEISGLISTIIAVWTVSESK